MEDVCKLFASENTEELANISKHLKGQLWPRLSDVFVYSCPAPLPGQLWPRVCNEICNVFQKVSKDPKSWHKNVLNNF